MLIILSRLEGRFLPEWLGWGKDEAEMGGGQTVGSGCQKGCYTSNMKNRLNKAGFMMKGVMRWLERKR